MIKFLHLNTNGIFYLRIIPVLVCCVLNTVASANICPTITITNPAVTTGTAGTPFNQSFTQSGGALPVTFTLNSGSLPAGLILSTGGVLSGTATVAGTYPVTVKVTDNNGCTGISATYNLVIDCPALPLTAGSNSPVCSGSSLNLTSTSGFTSYSWTGPNGFTSPQQNPSIPTVTASSGGTYTVTATGSTSTTVVLSYSQAFTQNVPPTVAQCNAWNSYRASLLGTYSYTGFTIHGSQNTVGISCTDPVVAAAVANALRTSTPYTGSSDGQTWTVSLGGCTFSACGGSFVELANQGNCSCNPGYSVRPNINNPNWGGISGLTCSALSQTLQVDFFGNTACTYSSSVTIVVTPPPTVGLTPSIQTICSGSTDNISVTPLIVSPADFEQAAALASNKGIYFDISNSSSIPLTVNSIRLEMVPPASGSSIIGQYKIYMTTVANTAVGNYNIPGNWTLLQGPNFNFPAGAGNLVYFSDFPLGGNSFTLQAGASKGIYLEATTTNFQVAYRNAASTVPTVTDGNITLTSRNSASGIFVASGADRTYYGKIGYASAYTYSWTRDNTTNVGGTSSGTTFPINDVLTNNTNVPQTTLYTVIASQGGGCTTSTATASVTVNPTPTFTTTVVNTTCNGGSNGQITVNVTGGTGTISYSKDGGTNYQASNVFTNLSAGTYTVTVKDVNTCSSTAMVSVGQPPAIVANIPNSFAVPPPGSAPFTIYKTYGSQTLGLSVVASGGTGSLTYSWSGSFIQGPANGTSIVVAPVNPGNYTYSVLITDAANCTTTKNVIVRVINVSCGGNKISLCTGGVTNLCIGPGWVPGYLSSGYTMGACGVGPIASETGPEPVVSPSQQTNDFKVIVSPNPSDHDFKIQVVGGTSESITVRLLDVTGRVLMTKEKVEKGQVNSIGGNLGAGNYFAEVIQGTNRKMINLIKL